MTKYVNIKVTIAPINSSESPRVIFFLNNAPIDEIPENKTEVIRWVDKFEELGLNFDTGEYNGDVNNLPLEYDLGYIGLQNEEMKEILIDSVINVSYEKKNRPSKKNELVEKIKKI